MAHDPDMLALLATIIDQPDAVAPRLVLADWLEERGDDAHGAMRWSVRPGVHRHADQKTIFPIVRLDRAMWYVRRYKDYFYGYELPRHVYRLMEGDLYAGGDLRAYPTAGEAWLDLLEAWRRCPHRKRPKVRHRVTT